jgi:hypothetical protein
MAAGVRMMEVDKEHLPSTKDRMFLATFPNDSLVPKLTSYKALRQESMELVMILPMALIGII